jgi:hypothetical protein
MADLSVPLAETIAAGDLGHADLHNQERDYINDVVTALADRHTKAEVTTLLGSVPTLDDLATSVYLGDIVGGTYAVFIAPFALRISQASFMTATAVASSTTASYLFELRRTRGNTFTTFTNKSTNSANGAGGQAISPYTDWNFDNVAWNGSVAQLSRGDAVSFRMAIETGSPTPTTLTRCCVTLRYVPL